MATPILVCDVETSGLSPADHGIVQIGIVPLLSAAERFDCDVRLREGAEWDPGAEKVHQRALERCQDLAIPSEAEMVDLLCAWLAFHFPTAEKFLLAGMNPQFDLSFLRMAFVRSGIYFPFTHRILDLHSLALGEAIRKNWTVDLCSLHTDLIYESLGMKPEPRPHVAINGAIKEREAILELLRRPNPSFA